VVSWVLETLDATQLSPSRLELELTESVIAEDPDKVAASMRELRAHGVRFSIDDFGTGYSSLNYLKRFPINAVKVDRAFVGGVATNESDGAIVSAVIAIARTLHLRVVAEGVETEDQFAFLQRRQCDEAQGFYFSPPLEADSIPRALAQDSVLDIRQSRLQM